MASKHDAIALLKADHRAVEELFEKYETAKSSEQKRAIAEKICQMLVVHTMIEEEIFYPAVRRKIDEEVVDEAYVEHDSAKVMIGEILAGSPSDEFYDAKVSVLAEEIKHHVHEEEKRGDGMFAQARAAKVNLSEVGRQLEARKEELLSLFEAEGIYHPITRTLRKTVQGAVAA